MAHDLATLSVLVIDDEPSFRRLARQILSTFGVGQIYCASSAEHALILLEDIQPDVTLLDQQMEGMSGIDLVRHIRLSDDSANRYLPIIMLTGHAEKQLICEARDAGVTEFMAKPMSARSLYSHLINVIEKPRPFIRTSTYFGPCRRRTQSNTYQGPERREIENEPIEFDPEPA